MEPQCPRNTVQSYKIIRWDSGRSLSSKNRKEVINSSSFTVKEKQRLSVHLEDSQRTCQLLEPRNTQGIRLFILPDCLSIFKLSGQLETRRSIIFTHGTGSLLPPPFLTYLLLTPKHAPPRVRHLLYTRWVGQNFVSQVKNS